jgi:hypothetical protein
MVGMAVGDHRMVHGAHRIDVKVPRRAIKALGRIAQKLSETRMKRQRTSPGQAPVSSCHPKPLCAPQIDSGRE